MRATAKYVRIVAVGVSLLSIACREPVAPDVERLVDSEASASKSNADRTKPTTPTNLRATSVGAASVSLAWDASTDNSGTFSYRVRNNLGYEFTVAQSQTSFVWNYRLSPSTSFTFSVSAVDEAGNKSASSSVSVTTTANVNAPSAPVLTVLELGPRLIKLGWKSTDDSPYYLLYLVTANVPDAGPSTTDEARTFYGLTPTTTYTFTVKTKDYAGNVSEPSTISVTTTAVNTSDTEAPTTPSGLWAQSFGDTEFEVFWTPSTDNVDPQTQIYYEVYVNGDFSDLAIGTAHSINYGKVGTNTIEIYAIDNAGNRSLAGTTTLVIP